ncbi:MULTISPECIES: DNA methyltransferase [unclassified Sphingomonas]|uniref:DNA methyltransferase n=1 Tax=unclassified Sphingomonas TaxID=196159 RepID=UPI0006FA502F|nr:MULTISPECIES: DNA methyltransferase [unclassified Sphingomonas]KQS49683.1 DNA methylase [Sphingomonas sp. Leaf198]
MRNRPENHLFYGDNLAVLRKEVADESVDLVYLDPPFNSNANYNILFRSPTGPSADAQIEAFEDTWHWNIVAEDAFDQVARSGNTKAFDLLNAMRGFLGDNDMMAYLAMMAVRLIELHRVLKPTGSLYLHCDPTASHYLKLLLDGVFGAKLFRNEIIWKRTNAHNDASQGMTRFGRTHDVILFYAKERNACWNLQFSRYDASYLKQHYANIDTAGRRYKTSDLTAAKPGGDVSYEFRGVTPPSGRYWAYSRANLEKFDTEGRLQFAAKSGMPRLKQYLEDMPGVTLGDQWDDISPINSQAQERLGYPTQKPVALLERIIAASSNAGDVVLDPFCGCGTAVHAAEKLGRQWIGIDVTHLAISLIEKRMRDAFPAVTFTVEGTPKDLASAHDLALRDKYQFQWWAVSMVDALPFGGRKKGADGGIDGLIYFNDHDPASGKMVTHRAIVSVKGGLNPDTTMVETLAATIAREKAPIGILIMNAKPTREMERRAAAVGIYRAGVDETFPKLQILTLADLFQGKRPRIPNVDRAAFRRAAREANAFQPSLL